MDNQYIDKETLERQKTATEQKKAKTKSKRTGNKKPNTFLQVLNGDILKRDFILKNLDFVFFILLLLLLVVGKGYYGKQVVNDVVKTQKEVDELTSDYFEAKARLEEKTQRSVLVEKLESTGLQETVNPANVIKLKKESER